MSVIALEVVFLHVVVVVPMSTFVILVFASIVSVHTLGADALDLCYVFLCSLVRV